MMMRILIQKELKSILLSPKFPASFAICTVLMLLSVYVGINEYHSSVRQYEEAGRLSGEEMRQAPGWMSVHNRVYRSPDPMQIFAGGISNDIGRWSLIDQFSGVKLRNSVYSDDPIFAVFRFIDFAFIVQIVLSLMAVLFTYDAVNGERESGTLQLAFSNSVSRAQYLVAKVAGAWCGLVIPVLIPVALSLLLLLLYRVPMTGAHWLSLATLLGASFLYFTFFVVFGVLTSTVTKRSAVSFLFALVAWLLLVLVIPRAGVIAAGQIVAVPTVAEVDGEKDTYAKGAWKDLTDEMEARWRTRQTPLNQLTKEERQKYQDDHLWAWMEQDDSARKATEKKIDEYGIRLNEDLRNRKAVQERLAFVFSRFSPASAYQLAAMDLGGTDLSLKSRYEDALQTYRTAFNAFTDKKQKESGGSGGIRITFDTDRGFSFDVPRERTLDLSGIPEFAHPQFSFSLPVIDLGILALYSLLAFAGAFVAFLRYDVR